MKNLIEFHAGIQTLELPDYEMSAKSRNTIGRAGAVGKTLSIFVLSCPDYASNGQEYTFGQLSDGVPLLTRLHLAGIEPLLELCQAECIKTEVEVLIADVEATNPALVNAYTGGSEDLYQEMCDVSVGAADSYLSIYEGMFPAVRTSANSFLRRFDPTESASHDPSENVFLRIRQEYIERMKRLLETDHRLGNKLLNNVRSKANSNYYQTEYGGRLESKEARKEQEITTMAEYLALGHLIGCLATDSVQPILVTHSTANVHLFNSINKINLADEARYPEIPAIPLAIYTRSVIAETRPGKVL